MAMLPIFICGLILGVMLGVAYINYKKCTPSNVKIHVLEDTIVSLKEDIALLEITNQSLSKALKEKKNRRMKNNEK